MDQPIPPQPTGIPWYIKAMIFLVVFIFIYIKKQKKRISVNTPNQKGRKIKNPKFLLENGD
jgi:hypothetical protein